MRSYLSHPIVQFRSIDPLVAQGSFPTEDPFLGADDPTFQLSLDPNSRRDQRDVGGSQLNPNQPTKDPALESYQRGITPNDRFKYVEFKDAQGRKIKKPIRIKNLNAATGETVFSGDLDLGSLTVVFSDS